MDEPKKRVLNELYQIFLTFFSDFKVSNFRTHDKQSDLSKSSAGVCMDQNNMYL